MHYYINPAWFYWISVLSTIKGVAIGAIVILCILVLVLGIIFLANDRLYDLDDEDEKKKYKKIVKAFVIAFSISIITAIFVPSKETCEKMMIASVVTEENVNATTDEVKELVDYIFEKFENLEKAKSN